MSTDRTNKKRRFPRIERIKIVEYGLIALIVLVFIALAIIYGNRKSYDGDRSDAPDASVPTASPVPTNDPSIRGMNVLDALAKAGFSVTYRESDRYDVLSPDGVAFVTHMLSDDRGVRMLSFETVLSPDPGEDLAGTEYAQFLLDDNKRTVDALQDLFDCVMPVFRRPAADSSTIVKQCQKVVKTFETYSTHKGSLTIRITSDAEVIPQTVLITLICDS